MQGSGVQPPSAEKGAVLISANAFWNIAHFRARLIEALVAEGYAVSIACPQPDRHWAVTKGVEAFEIRMDRSGLSPLRDGTTLINYLRLFVDHRPKFFLGFTAKPNIYGSIAARLVGAMALPNVSGLGTAFINPGPLSAILGMLYRAAFRKCPVVFFQNPDDRDLFVERNIVRPEQAQLLPGSGVDLHHFTPQPVRDGPIRFLFVGRLLGDKGVREFVEAARLLKTDHPDWSFQLLGPLDPGNRSGILQPELDSWVAQNVVDYLGETSDVRSWLAEATAVVLPSYREGLPRSLLEGASAARPLIASDVPGNRQVVKHGVNGLLCAARDCHSLADAMRTLAQLDPADRAAMGGAGRKMIEEGYREDGVVRAYLDLMVQLAETERV